MTLLKALSGFLNSVSHGRDRVLFLFFGVASVFMFYSLTRFNLGINVNLFFIIANFLFVIHSVLFGVLSLILTISLFAIVESNAVVTFDITLFLQGYYLLLFFLYVVMFFESRMLTKVKPTDKKILFVYLFIIFLYAGVGILNGVEFKAIFVDHWFMFMFWTLPLTLPFFLKDSDIKKIFLSYLVLLVIISFYYYRASALGIYNHGETRIYTRQIFMLSYILPLIFAWLLNSKNREMVVLLTVFIVSIGTIIISQTRIVFAGVALSALIAVILNYRFSFKKIVAGVGLVFIGVFSLDFLPFHGIEAFDRLLTIRTFYLDASFLMRFVTIYDVVSQHGMDLLKGMGLGHIFHLRGNILYQNHVEGWIDIGYVSVAAKIGLAGLIVFMAIIIRVFYCSLYCYRKNMYINRYHKIATIGVMSAIPSLLVQFFLFSLLIKYIYIISITPFFAMSLYYYHKIKQGQNEAG